MWNKEILFDPISNRVGFLFTNQGAGLLDLSSFLLSLFHAAAARAPWQQATFTLFLKQFTS